MAAVPRALPNPLRGGRPLDPERPTPDPERPVPGPEPGPGTDPGAAAPSTAYAAGPGFEDAASEPRGLRDQVRATKDAAMGFVRAHVDLAKAEANAIKGEIARAAALGGVAIAALILLALLLSIGGMLFAGEWIFGSIGWGVLLGAELLIAVALTAVLVALRIPGLGRDILVALVIGVVAGIVLGLNLPNELFRRIGEALNLGVDPAVRPLAVGAALVAIIGALLGLVLGMRAGGGAAVAGLIAGAIGGAVVGAFLAITFGPRVGAALGVATFLLAWPVLMGVRVARKGIDTEALKARFYPETTIETAKESIEWAKARVPRGPTS